MSFVVIELKQNAPQLPGGPDPNAPIPTTPVSGVDLRAYATIVGRIAARTRPRAEVLAEAGIDEARWIEVEKTWLLRLATAAMTGDLSLPREHDEVFAKAKTEASQGSGSGR